jgi:putative phosphoribosyl transferase
MRVCCNNFIKGWSGSGLERKRLACHKRAARTEKEQPGRLRSSLAVSAQRELKKSNRDGCAPVGCAPVRRSSPVTEGWLLKHLERFPNLSTAGRDLSPRLIAFQNAPDTIVLGVALAGVPVAREVANSLRAPLDLILIRRLLLGNESGSHVCAVNVAGTMVLDDEITLIDTPSTPLEYFLSEAVADLRRREQVCRRGRAPLDLTDRTLMVVDCGIRTGSTMKAAVRALRKLNAKRIIGAVPVSSREGQAAVGLLFDEFVCLMQPEQFINAGYWYTDFSRPGDDEVGELLGSH